MGVFAVLGHKLVMGAAFDDPPMLKHVDPVCHLSGGKPVGDEDKGLISRVFGNGTVQLKFPSKYDIFLSFQLNAAYWFSFYV